MTGAHQAPFATRASPAALVAGLGAAVALRAVLSARSGPADPIAAAGFAAVVGVVALAGGWRPRLPAPGWLAWGGAGAVGLVAGPLLRHGHNAWPAMHSRGGFAGWAAVVAAVAVAEEALLRGALWRALRPKLGTAGTVAVSAALFAVIHVPLYGLPAVPLDVVAGVWLGLLRWASGTVAAPAAAHVLADWAGWWMA